MVLVVEVGSKEWVVPRSWCSPGPRQLDIQDRTRVSRVEEEDTSVWGDDVASGHHQGIGNHSLQIENFFYMTRVHVHHVVGTRVHQIFCSHVGMSDHLQSCSLVVSATEHYHISSTLHLHTGDSVGGQGPGHHPLSHSLIVDISDPGPA